jgi:integrase
MLFKVYSRFIPNLTRMDGSAFERLLGSRVNSRKENEYEIA